jgi:hypothetical protein
LETIEKFSSSKLANLQTIPLTYEFTQGKPEMKLGSQLLIPTVALKTFTLQGEEV